jgi:inhibitor of cysteine peptidase
MRKQLSKILFLVMLIFMMVLSACQPSPIIEPDPDSSVSPSDPVNKPVENDFEGFEQKAYVDSMEILIMESFPVQVRVNVVGNLPDGCTSIVGSKSEMVDNSTFELSIFTERPEDMMCTQALVPFEESISLEVEGLSAGTYTVKGFDLEETFTLDIDNK